MNDAKQTIAARAGRRLLSIIVAIPAAVIAGFATVLMLDAMLPHGKGWQLPVIFLGAFVAAALAGVSCMRMIAPNQTKQQHSTTDQPHPFDAD